MQTAEVNLRTAKIELLMLLNDRRPVEEFHVAGPFDYSEQLQPLDDFRKMALDNRPDPRAAVETVNQAKTNHKLAHGGASLLDFLSAKNDYRSVQLDYVNLVGSYLTAAAQLNMAVGREVIQ